MVSYTLTHWPLKILKMRIEMNPYEEDKKYSTDGKLF